MVCWMEALVGLGVKLEPRMWNRMRCYAPMHIIVVIGINENGKHFMTRSPKFVAVVMSLPVVMARCIEDF